jgi:uncharacterized membrane protein
MISIPVSTRPARQKSEARARSEPSYELWTVLAALTLLYVVAVLEANRRFVWFDELYTLDLAKATTIPQIWQLIRRFDFQPPALYLLSRFSMKLFGQSPFGLRFPSMLEFYVGSMALFFFVRRKVGISYAAAAVLILWLGATFPIRHGGETLRPLNDVVFYSLALLGHCNDLRKSPSCIMGRRYLEFSDA